ncbi:MAG: AbiH family protein [Armatimonas sp.]
MQQAKHTILVGNSINQLRITKSADDTQVSWRDLLQDMQDNLDIVDSFLLAENSGIPFPLAFEGLLHTHTTDKTIQDVKDKVSIFVERITHNKFHKQLMELEFENILTTNYDHTLEQSISLLPKGEKNYAPRDESFSSKYSLFRCCEVEGMKTRVWHVHGQQDDARTIILGYDEYAGNLQRIRQYLVRYGYKGRKSPLKNYKSGKNIDLDFDNYDYDSNTAGRYHSWVDLFLRDNIHIVGLSLGFEEIDMWWLLYHKAEVKSYMKDYNLGSAFFYDFVKPPASSDSSTPSLSPKALMLQALGVEVVSIPLGTGGYEQAWIDMLAEIRNKIHAPPNPE